MSLSDESKSSLLTQTSSPTGYVKVVYFKFNDKITTNIPKDVGISNEEFDELIFKNIGDSDKVTKLFSTRDSLLGDLSPKNIDIIKYIFVGNQSDDVNHELSEISNNILSGNDPYLDIDTATLSKNLGFNSAQDMMDDFNLEKETELKFLNIFISNSNNIFNVSQIISNSLTSESEELIMPSSLFMYGKKTDDFIESKFNEIKYNIIKEFKQNKSEYSVNSLISKLVSYMVPLRIIEYFLKLLDESTISAKLKIIDNYAVRRYICNYIKYNNLTHEYLTKTNLEYPIDSNIGYYFHKSDNQNSSYSEPLQLKNIKLSDIKLLNTLEDTFIRNNTIYMYNYFNIEKHLKKIDSTDLVNKKQFYSNFIVKYFPNLRIDKVLIKDEELIDTIKNGYLDNRGVIMNYSNINDTLHKLTTLESSNVDLIFDKQFIMIVRKKINLPFNFDFRNLFNELILSKDMPFVKFRDIHGTKDVIYKIFKPSTEKESEKHVSDISRDQLDEWIKFKGYEFAKNDLKKVKAHPKYISYKCKFARVNNESPIKGSIYISNPDDTFEIITNTGQIYSNIPIQNIINPPSSLTSESEVRFYKNEFIYADIDLFKKEFLEFTIDLRLLPEINNDMISNVKESINNFINTVFSTESLKRYETINNFANISYQNKNKLETISNLTYKYNAEFNKDHKLDYKTLEQVSYILHPFVIIKDELFSLRTPIEFFDIDSKLWIKGIIKKINIDFTYDIQLHDPVQKINTMITKESVEKIYLRLGGGKTSRIFRMNYKQISGFDDMTPINSFLNKLNSVGLDNNNQVKKLIDVFLIEREKAIQIVSSYVDNSENNKKTAGINISLDYTAMLYNPSETKMGVFIENVNSLQQVSNVNMFLKLFFELALIIRKYTTKNTIFNSILTSEIIDDDGNINDKKIKENQEKYEKQMSPKKTQNILDIENDEYSDIEDDDDDLFGDSDDELEVEEELEIEEEETDIKQKETQKSVIDELLTDAKLSKGSNKLHSSMVLNKLKLRDPKLFDWSKEGTQSTGYSRTCQAGRQPQVLTQLEKKEFDDEFTQISKDWGNTENEKPLSAYSANDVNKDGANYDYIDCDENSVKALSQEKQCKALKWGSAADSSLHNWYICPKIFDLNENKPIHLKQLKFKRTSPKFKPSKNINSGWRTHSDTDPKFDGLDILEFQPYYEKDGNQYLPWVKSSSDPEPTIYKSLLFAAKKEQDGLTPGLKNKSQHPEGYYMPCCFKKSMNVEAAFKVNTGKADIKTNYIQNWGHGLSEGKYGLLHKVMEKHLFNTNIETGEKKSAETGLIRDNKGCFIRYGVENSYDNIFKLFSILHNIDTTQIIDNIIRKLTVNNFSELNLGDLHNQFDFNGLQSPYQNFLEYVLSNQFKNFEFFVELLTTKKYGIVSKDINVLVLDIDHSNNSLELICSNYYDFKFDSVDNTAFVLKTSSGHYELLCKFHTFSDDPIFIFNKYELLVKHNYLNAIFSKIEDTGKCAQKHISQLTSENNVMGLITNDDVNKTIDTIEKNLSGDKSIKNIIHDSYNKAVGLYLNNNVTIPIYPQSIKTDIPSISLESIEPVDIKLIEETYNLINKHLEPGKLLEIIDYFKSEENNYVIANTGNYIKVISIPEEKLNSSIVKTDYFKLDNELYDYKESIKKSIYKPPIQIYQLIKIIQDIKGVKLLHLLINIGRYAYAVILENSLGHKLIVPIQRITLKQFEVLKTEILSDKSYTDSDLIIKNIKSLTNIEEFEIDIGLQSYMDSIVQFSRLSYYKIPCLPARALFGDDLNEKKYESLILETGLNVELNKSVKFNIWSKDSKFKFIIDNLIDTPVVDRLFFNVNPNIPSELINDRIVNNIRINYISSLYQIIKSKIYEIFQSDKFIDIKDFIQSVIKNPVIKNNYKKILIRPIMKLIFSILVKEVEDDITNFKDINNKIKCADNSCDNLFCVNEKSNIESIYKSLLDQDILKLGVLSIDKTELSDVDESQISDITSKVNPDLLKRLFSSYRDCIIIFEGMDKLCKIKVNTATLADVFQFGKMKNKILNEMIFNKYRSYELFNYINKDISNEELVANSDSEFLFASSEYTMSTLNQLYMKSLNKYYYNNLPFDKSIQRISSIQIDKLKDFIIKSCKLNDEFNMYEVDTLKCALEPIKNKNKGIDKSLQEYLSEKEISDLSEFINKL